LPEQYLQERHEKMERRRRGRRRRRRYRSLDAVHDGHLHIHEDHIETRVDSQLHRLFAIHRRYHLRRRRRVTRVVIEERGGESEGTSHEFILRSRLISF